MSQEDQINWSDRPVTSGGTMKASEWWELLAGIAMTCVEQGAQQRYGLLAPVALLSLSIGLRLVKAKPGVTLVLAFVLLNLVA
ncbi:hypothetical protein JS756_13475 [Streptomyces actuosus]|uniref:Energy-coupling factor transporter transmembrane protein EcfT n=1 Tax=Streptomyces actuosus TaxID=1885 RepID=A0ABS2VPR6_STRAS|nr:hypothetical protein [Streptomyces actuosus]MBN0045102.1 hypothetical protein [Streptomyces actuosus]